MPYTAPTTRATLDLITASIYNTDLVNNISYLANPPACRVYHNTTQSIPQGASTVVALNSERFDTDAMHDTVTNNSRVTINTAGLYVVHFHGQLAAAGDYTLVEMFIRKNGTDIIANQTVGTHANATDGPSCSPSCLYKFIVGDYVQGLVYQSNGAAAARNLNASGTGTGQYDAELSAVWVGLG